METIKISDLSVGDWVKVIFNKCDYDDPETLDAKVLSIEGNSVGVGYDNSGIVMSAFVEDLQPIPITAEILEKNGFERLLERDLFYHSESGLEVAFEDGEWTHTINLHEYTIHTISGVHHIQHLLRLYGCEKEINL